MIGMRTILQVADNSGARRLSCILPLGGDVGVRAGLGDVVTAAVKEAAPDSAITAAPTAAARRTRCILISASFFVSLVSIIRTVAAGCRSAHFIRLGRNSEISGTVASSSTTMTSQPRNQPTPLKMVSSSMSRPTTLLTM